MTADVRRRLDVGVTEEPADEKQICSLFDQESGSGVAQLVWSEWLEIRSLDRGGPEPRAPGVVPKEPAFLDNPVEPHELLRSLPDVLAAIQQDPVKTPPKWWPDRLNDYIERYMDAHPEYEDRRVDIEEAYCRHPSIAMFEISDAIEERGA